MSLQKLRPKSKASSLGVEEVELGGDWDAVIDPAVEKKLIRKLDWRLIPWLCLLYLISFLDRTNIGNAKIAGNSDFMLTDPRTWKGLEHEQ